MKTYHHIPASLVGKRLDQALAFFYPRASLRERRKWIAEGGVRVGGRAAPAGLKVGADQEIQIVFSACEKKPHDEVYVLAREKGLAGVYKPPGLHSQRGKGLSLEDMLPDLLGPQAILLNRLDYLTSGIVLAATDKGVQEAYLRAQQTGKVKKIYLALVAGELREEMACTLALDCRKRKKVKVLKREEPLSVRHTLVRPVRFLGSKTLVRACIGKGQRHQIRAHLADAGFPIIGDPLYGKQPVTTRLFLQHTAFCWDNFCISVLPDWPEVRGFSFEFQGESGKFVL